MYKAVLTSDTYLIHYNKNHSKSNGQFTSGDGDGDGIANDHANQRKSKSDRLREATARAKKEKKVGTGLLIGSSAAWLTSVIAAAASEADDTPASAAVGIISAASAIGLDLAGSIIYDKANRKLKKETDRIINEHYDAPITEAWDELNR